MPCSRGGPWRRPMDRRCCWRHGWRAHCAPPIACPRQALAGTPCALTGRLQHWHRGTLEVADLAAQVHLSPSQFADRCRDEQGHPPMVWLRTSAWPRPGGCAARACLWPRWPNAPATAPLRRLPRALRRSKPALRDDGAAPRDDGAHDDGPLSYSRRMQANLYALGAIALWASLASLGVSLTHIPPFLLTGITLIIGSVPAWPFVLRDPSAMAHSLRTLALGVYGLFAYHFLLFIALRHAPPVEANLVNYLWPLFIVVLAPVVLPGVALRCAACAGGPAGVWRRSDCHRGRALAERHAGLGLPARAGGGVHLGHLFAADQTRARPSPPRPLACSGWCRACCRCCAMCCWSPA
jgi:hypothetical protein